MSPWASLGGRPGAVHGAEEGPEAPGSFSPPLSRPLSSSVSVCSFRPLSYSLFTPSSVSTTLSQVHQRPETHRATNDRSIQPHRYREKMGREGLMFPREYQSWGPHIPGLSLHPSTSFPGQSAAFSPEGQPMGGYTEAQPHMTVRPAGKSPPLT